MIPILNHMRFLSLTDSFFGLDCFAGTAFSGTTAVFPRTSLLSCLDFVLAEESANPRSYPAAIAYFRVFTHHGNQAATRFAQRPTLFCGRLIVSYPAEIAYFSPPNRELSKDLRPKELRKRKIVDPSRGAP